MTLDKRKSQILESIIRDYVETAEPVGSRSIVKKHNLKISAATVRNEMADLEEMGYLEQPHTSAGRIPSQVGFRYYVDCMMQKETWMILNWNCCTDTMKILGMAMWSAR